MRTFNLEKKHIPCPVCNASDYIVLYEDTLGDSLPEFGYNFDSNYLKTYRIVKCSKCGHSYCSPMPQNIYLKYKDIEDQEYLHNNAQRISTAKKVLKIIKKFKDKGRLLDIGCATGDFLNVAKETYQAEGIELSKWSSSIAKQSGLVIYEDRLETFKPIKPYDIVVLWGVIEHLEQPKKEIEYIAKIQKQGSILCIWTGDIDSIFAKLLGRKWWYIMGQHIQYFSRSSLDYLMEESGYTRIYNGNYPYVLTMSSLAKTINRYPFVSFIFGWILNLESVKQRQITFALPGEMFMIYEKIS